MKLGNPHLGKVFEEIDNSETKHKVCLQVKIPTMKMVKKPAGNTTNARKAKTVKADDYTKEMVGNIEAMKTAGATSLRQIAEALNEDGCLTKRGKEWTAAGVQRILNRTRG
jgi:hypothetical protein